MEASMRDRFDTMYKDCVKLTNAMQQFSSKIKIENVSASVKRSILDLSSYAYHSKNKYIESYPEGIDGIYICCDKFKMRYEKNVNIEAYEVTDMFSRHDVEEFIERTMFGTVKTVYVPSVSESRRVLDEVIGYNDGCQYLYSAGEGLHCGMFDLRVLANIANVLEPATRYVTVLGGLFLHGIGGICHLECEEFGSGMPRGYYVVEGGNVTLLEKI